MRGIGTSPRETQARSGEAEMSEADSFIAFIDESGNEKLPGQGEGGSNFFVISAVILKQQDYDIPRDSIESIKRIHFQTGEMKSVNISNNHSRRSKLLDDLNRTGIKHVTIIIDKKQIDESSGLKFKKTFRKNLPGKIYKILFGAYKNLIILSDEHGSKEFMESVRNYVNQKQMSLFESQKFEFASSRDHIFIQFADIICGTWQKVLDPSIPREIREVLKEKLLINNLLLQIWPPSFDFREIIRVTDSDDNDVIRNYCLIQAVRFIQESQLIKKQDPREQELVSLRIDVLNFLYSQCIMLDSDSFMISKRIITYLKTIGYERIGKRKLSSGVFSFLRDHGVIVSSGNRGYKIPTSLDDIIEYVDNVDEKTIPMIKRLDTAREQIRAASKGKIDIIQRAEKHKLDELAKCLKDVELENLNKS